MPSIDSGPDVSGLAGLMNAILEEYTPTIHRMGIRVVELRPGRAVGVLPLAGNGNHLGTMYAGALFAVAEMLGGALFLPSFDAGRMVLVVKDLAIRYRRPAMTDVRAEAELDLVTIEQVQRTVEIDGKADFELDARLFDTAGEVVATTHGTYQVRLGEFVPPGGRED